MPPMDDTALPRAANAAATDAEAEAEAERARFRADVRAGLAQAQKALPCKWLYDEAGSALFDRICDVPEYYPTRTEMALLAERADAIAGHAGTDADLVEFGSGASRKIRLVLDALDRPAGYVAIDISGDFLVDSCARLAADYPDLPIRPVQADYTRAMTLPEPAGAGRRLGFFPGSTIGNFDPAVAADFLARARDSLGGGSAFVVGVDLAKPADVLEPAYDDAGGVTAAFNLNLLTRINRELDGGFDLDRFRHEARWNAEASRVEMHLVSTADQQVPVAGDTVAFAAGESIHTENSYKYRLDGFRALAEEAGWRTAETWTDADDLFSLHVLEAA